MWITSETQAGIELHNAIFFITFLNSLTNAQKFEQYINRVSRYTLRVNITNMTCNAYKTIIMYKVYFNSSNFSHTLCRNSNIEDNVCVFEGSFDECQDYLSTLNVIYLTIP